SKGRNGNPAECRRHGDRLRRAPLIRLTDCAIAGHGWRVASRRLPRASCDNQREDLFMNAAESLVHTLLKSGVDTCFSNPGTSEMHFVAALDRVPGMRCVLGMFEGVVTGAADGYARMAGKPAATLLHCGP